MKKILLAALFLMPIAVSAQTETESQSAPQPAQQIIQTVMQRFGYLSFDNVMKQMPEYDTAMNDYKVLQERYAAEARRSEQEFNQKYVELLEGQKDFPENILKKRQKELQNLMEQGLQFRKEAERLLEKARKELMLPVEARLKAVLKSIGDEQGYAYILNTDGNNYPYINAQVGEDITAVVRARLGVK